MNEADSDAFVAGYLACGFLLGQRDCELCTGVQASPAMTRLLAQLNDPDRQTRARALAQQLSKVMSYVSRQRLR